MLVRTTFEQESQESILFHPVLKAYPTHNSWIITAQVLLGDLDAYTTESKITTITKFTTAETTSSKLSTLSITGIINQLGRHLYIL